jgi:hypothetical protein
MEVAMKRHGRQLNVSVLFPCLLFFALQRKMLTK